MPDAMMVGISQSSETTSAGPEKSQQLHPAAGRGDQQHNADREDVRKDGLLHPQGD